MNSIGGSPRWTRLRQALLTCCLGFWGLACQPKLSEPECGELLDRYVELLSVTGEPQLSADELTRRQQEARAKAASDPRFGACSDEVSRRQYDCAMSAPNADRLEQCLVF